MILGLDCGDEDSRDKVCGFVLGAAFWSIAFLLLVNFVVTGLVGKDSVLDRVDDLVALVSLLDIKLGADCEEVSIFKVGARYTEGNAD